MLEIALAGYLPKVPDLHRSVERRCSDQSRFESLVGISIADMGMSSITSSGANTCTDMPFSRSSFRIVESQRPRLSLCGI
ncbi:hypothetical protein HYQ46_004549 [Verticillium longisporum]|nr:hypothetical protein HYQ46_004549 [Verticillium longisporum]